VPYELPEDRHDRRSVIWRWVTFAMVAALVALLAYLLYAGFVGSDQVVNPARSRDCTTPGTAFGWEYEAINYEPASDDALADIVDSTDCDMTPASAGDRLVTADGLGLAGWYIPAGNGSGPEGATIVLAHGHGVNKSAMLARAELLHRDYNLVLFDFRNHGQSEDGMTTVGMLERADLRAVIDWLVEAKGPEAIGVLGVSMGGAVTINEARADSRVRAVVLDSTHAKLANALQARLDRQGYPLSLPASWAILLGGLMRTGQDMSAADPLLAVEAYGERPLLLVSGGRSSDLIGPHDADELLAAARQGGADAQLRICEEAGHAEAVRACPREYRDWVLGFFADALGA
jgi:pimeloyl-ACP methyl ester carboxylesterase